MSEVDGKERTEGAHYVVTRREREEELTMSDPRYARTGGSHPTREQAQHVWMWLSLIRRVRPNLEVVGAYDAAEWTYGLTDATPVSSVNVPASTAEITGYPDPKRIRAEAYAAYEVASGKLPGDREKALGAFAWLAWWAGEADLPEWLTPRFEELLETG